MTDNRFSEDQDGRFFGREDWRFLVAGSDRRFPSPGVDTRFSGSIPWGSPASFFAGANGAWFDPSDITTLYQDSAGTTPVTAAGQPVGRMLDKSGNGNHASQPTGSKRPTYQTGGGLAWLDFSGATKRMQTPIIDFTGSDQLSVFAGVRKLSDAAYAVILEIGAGAEINPGTAILYAPRVANSVRYRFTSYGTSAAPAGTNNVAYAAPVTSVLTGYSDISARICTLRIDGALIQNNTVSQGTGNYGANSLSIGGRHVDDGFFNGNIYGMVVIGRQPDDAGIQSIESYLAAKTGVTI